MPTSPAWELNLLYLLFLLVPGYLSLKGYLSATIQLDTTSRLDKLLLTVIGGLISLAIILILNRLGIFDASWNYVTNILFDVSRPVEIGYREENRVDIATVRSLSALAAMGFIGVQSVIGFFGGYLLGTAVRIRSEQPQKSDKDLQQPWETAVRGSKLGDDVTVVTTNEQEIRGRLYRIGSPSTDFDLLLAAAERISDKEDNEPLGVTYHNYRDISRVTFPKIKPREESEEGNWILRQWNKSRQFKRRITAWIAIRRYGFDSIERSLEEGSIAANCLMRVYQEQINQMRQSSHSTAEDNSKAIDEQRD